MKSLLDNSSLAFAVENGRTIPTEDKIFGISNRAKGLAAREGKDKVVNGTIGALLDDQGNLMVLKAVDECFKRLEPAEYAAYAPIGGTEAFKRAAIKSALGDYQTKRFAEAVATPGGTGAIRNTIANYSKRGDKVLTTDWHWSPYGTIAGEQERSIATFTMFTEERSFNLKAFEKKVLEILKTQDTLVVLLNTPAHNPTGYAITNREWKEIVKFFGTIDYKKRVALFIDAAYIDFAGDEQKYRSFFPIIEGLPENVLPIVGCSMSKTFTMYGMRCGAAICLAPTLEIAEEFKRVFEYSSRGSWSNSPLAPQNVIANLYAEEELLKSVSWERKEIRDMLLRRGKAFEKEAAEIGLEIVPFDAGFFVSIPHDEPDKVCKLLEEEGIFLVPLGKGIRVSVASISEKVAGILPKKILAAIERIG